MLNAHVFLLLDYFFVYVVVRFLSDFYSLIVSVGLSSNFCQFEANLNAWSLLNV